MHLEVLVGAVAKELRAAWPEVGEPGDELLGRRGHRLMYANRGHECSLREGCRVHGANVHQTLVWLDTFAQEIPHTIVQLARCIARLIVRVWRRCCDESQDRVDGWCCGSMACRSGRPGHFRAGQ